MDNQLKRFVFFLAAATPVAAQMASPVINGSPAITAIPPSGTYTGSRTVTLKTRIPSRTTFYTLDGTTPSTAAAQYTSAVTVASSGTLNALAASTGTVAQNTGSASTKWKCVTHGGGTFGSLSCQAGGGVGSSDPTNVTWTYGNTMAETMTGPPGTQILYVYSGTACDTCNAIAQTKWVNATVDKTVLQNNEMDVSAYDQTHARLHMFGLQCNQQATLGRWQIDNQQGSWQDTPGPIRDCCPIPTSGYCKVVLEGHWDLNDTTGCNGANLWNNGPSVSTGYGCEVFDALTITQCNTTPTHLGNDWYCPAANIVSGPTRYPLNVKMNSYTESGWTSYCGNQDQLDLVTSGSSMTAGRNVIGNNVTCWHSGTSATLMSPYTIQ